MHLKRTLLLTAFVLLILGGSAYIWLQREGRSAGSIAPSATDDRAGTQRNTAAMRGADLAGVSPRTPSETRLPHSDSLTTRTTWSAHVVAREDQRPLSGVTLRVKLLSPDMVTQDLVLITDDDGRAGPIDVDYDRYPAAEVRVDPGSHWAGHFTTALFAAGEANHDVIELASPVTFSVHVIDHPAGAPLSGAGVTVRDASGIVAREVSNAEGLARFPWTAPGGPFSIGAAADGFSAVFCVELARPPSSDLEVCLLLAQKGALNVRVQDEDRRTIDGCSVTADPVEGSLPPISPASSVRPVPARWDPPVEESGAYVLASVPCETILVVRAVLPDGRAGQEFARVPAPLGFADVTITIPGAAGTEVWTFDDRGATLGEVAIGAERKELGMTDESGRLNLALQEPARELWAHKVGYALGWQPWAPGLASVIYNLAPERLTSGTVVDSSGRPQRWVRITPLLGAREEPYDARRRRGELVTSRGRANAARTDASGAFELHGLGGGWIDLHVRTPKQGSFEVEDVLVGTEGLVITIPDASTLGIEQGIALLITVRDEATGEPVKGALVTVFHAPDPASKSFKDGRTEETGADGTVRLTSAHEGHYKVAAVADGYVPFSAPITEYPIGEHAIEVRLVPAADLEVSLVNQAGIGLQGYWIRALGPHGVVSFEHVDSSSGGEYSQSAIITDVEGRARANRMPPGTLVLEVYDGPGGKGAALVRKEIELIAGERTEVELKMP